MKNNKTNKNIFSSMVNLIICVTVLTVLLTSCSSSAEINIAKTKLPAVYSNGYVYFFRDNTNKEPFEQGNDLVLTRYNISSGEEDGIAKTNCGFTPRVYNGNIYYFENESHDICAINEKNLKTHIAYSPYPTALFESCYAATSSEFIYLESGKLSIQHKTNTAQIENVYDFTICNGSIYYVTGDFSNDEFYVNKLLSNKTLEAEKIIDIQDILDIGKSDITEQSRINHVDAYNDMLYIMITDDFTMNELYVYDMSDNTLDRIGKDCVYEYQVKDGYVYCRERDTKAGGQNVIKYDSDGNNGEVLIQDATTFVISDDDIIMYTLPRDDKLYVKGDSVDIQISDLSWFD